MSRLASKECLPFEEGFLPLSWEEKVELKRELHDDWIFFGNAKKLSRKIKTDDFKSSLDLAVKIGEIANHQWHHPELVIAFGFIVVEIWTHKIGDLLESDFIFAAKVDLSL